jgi:hypothetical protein
LPETKPHARPELPPVEVSGRVGGDVVVGDYEKNVRAGRDVVGRDVVTTSNTTNVGFSAAAVQRLLITVGMMVFVTAACFFSGGVIVGGTALAALDRQVASDDPAAAAEFAELLQILRDLPPGQVVQFSFTEQQLSAYFRQEVAPTLPLDITEAKVRLLDSGDLVVGGRAGALGGARFAATFVWQDEVGAPLRLDAAAVEVLPLRNRVFGWVAVPTLVLRPLTDGLNDLFGGVQVTDIGPEAHLEDTWTATAVSR